MLCLGRGDHDGPREAEALGDAELGIARAWRHVDDQDVQGAPFDFVDEGIDRAHHHGAPPHSRLVILHVELGLA